ncbi:MAG: argininosuccinate lyase [Gemmiger sp.]
MMPQLWQGRSSKAVDSRVNDFNSSIRFDARMIEQDIQGSMVHSEMLGRQGIISQQDVEQIHAGLASILEDLHSGALEIDPAAEDVHTFVEQTLTARVGDAGKRLHTGRSRNDQVALDIRLYLREAFAGLESQLTELIETLCRQAEKGAGYVMPGYTHLQRAQPVTFGHQLMAYAWMFVRDLGRMKDAVARMDAECPLGSGALAGTTYPLDRFYTAEQLGFDAPCGNSIDGVSDRDFCIELTSAMATCMMHLSRLSEEIILWCSWEFKFIELDDAFTTGSSIMPQKKNPDVTELIRGKTGRVYGDLNTLLVMMKGLPLAYDKDMQEDKEAVFDAVDTLALCLKTITPMLDTMTPLPDNMRRAAAKGFINATDCADYLTRKGMPFRDAYKCTGTMVGDCITKGKTLEELTLEEFRGYSALFDEDIYEAIDLTTCCEGRTSYGGPTKQSVLRQVADVRKKIAEMEA